MSLPPKLPSVAVFCPQSKAPGTKYLESLQSYITGNDHLEPLVRAIRDIADTWDIFAKHREDIAALDQGPRYMKSFSNWITTGESTALANAMSGIISLPLLTIIQTCQYFQYLEMQQIPHRDLAQYLRKSGGIQGYCGGLLPAMAIACSKDEAEVVENVAKAMRLAVGIGAFGELGDDENIPGPTTIVVRLKYVGQGDEIVKKFPGSYLSAITDPKTISIVGSAPLLEKLSEYARSQGLLVQGMHLRGKVHNPENADLAEEMCTLAEQHHLLSLPHSSGLRIPIRSNLNGAQISEVSLTHEVIRTVLACKCEWYTLLQGIAEDLEKTSRKSHLFAIFGIGDCVPLSPFHMKQLQITKLDVLSHVERLSKERTTPEFAYPEDAVAIVGAACRLPGADSLDELWDLLVAGSSEAIKLPTNRFDLYGSLRASQDQKWLSKQKFCGNFIDEVEGFDNAFFRISPREAVNMDPQQRLLLEVAYQAMESSGYLRFHERQFGDNVGCFIGASFTEYLENTAAYAPTAFTSTGTIRAFLCGKISHYFGWSGPSEVIDTACSASLVAINRACKAIQSGECPMALAGGVNVLTGIQNYLDLGKAGFLSSTGQCKPFDVSADGYCRADGCSLVVLKSLRQAVADNQQILGVIAGVSTNQGGLSPSITVPHSPAQIKLYQSILRQANMEPAQVSYAEAHGTGTQVGDPLEMASIRQVFGGPSRSTPLTIGSIKGNIGHSETNAGAASLCKVLAMLQHGGIPPLVNYKKLNPKIPALEPDRMRIATSPEQWDVPFRAACVNSYGAAGSNSALICCQYPAKTTTPATKALPSKAALPIILSAASKESLVEYAHKFEIFLNRPNFEPSMADIAFTLSERRKHHPVRFTGEFSSIAEFKNALKSTSQSCFEIKDSDKKICLVFSGQSRQTVGLEKNLYESVPRLKHYVDCCNDIVVKLGHSPLVPAIFSTEPLSDIVTLQCSTFAFQYACAMCWIESGLVIAAIIGHSFGELTAMAVSGILSLEDGLKLVAVRASLMQTKWGSERGTMLAIHRSREIVEEIIKAGNSSVEVACYNSSSSQVVVGTATEITELEEMITATDTFKGTRTQRLNVSHGFHSVFTEALLEDLEEVAQSLNFRQASIPLETCTAERCSTIMAKRVLEHTRSPVFFEDAVRRIEDHYGSCIWLEAGTNSPIIPMVKKAVSKQDKHTFFAIDASSSEDPLSQFRSTTIKLWRDGIKTSYIRFLSPEKSGFKQIWIPPYAFQRTKHWLPNIDRAIEAMKQRPATRTAQLDKPRGLNRLMLVSRKGGSKFTSPATFAINIDTRRYQSIVSGHAVRQRALCPASVYMECAVMAAQILGVDIQNKSISFKDISFQSALGTDLGRDVTLSMETTDRSNAWSYDFKSKSKTDERQKVTTHGKGRISFSVQDLNLQSYQRVISSRIKVLSQRNPDTETLRSNRAYGLFSQVVTYAPLLRGISSITLAETEALASIEVPLEGADTGESTVTGTFECVALDCFIQVVGLLINSSSYVTPGEVFIASGINSASLLKGCDFHKTKNWTVYAMYTPLNDRQMTGDVYVFTKQGTLVMTFLGSQFSKVPIATLEKMLDAVNPQSSKHRNVTPSLTPVQDDRGSSIGSMSPGEPTHEADTPLTNFSSDEEDEISTRTGGADGIRRFGGGDSMPNPMIELKSSPKQVEAAGQPLEGTQKETNSSIPHSEQGSDMKLLEIIAVNCGASASTIKNDYTLRDLGVDSLSAIELKSEIEEAFSTEIGDEDVTLESKVQDIIAYLGLDKTGLKPSANGNSTTVSKHFESLAHPAVQNEEQIPATNPFDALHESEQIFEPTSKRLAYAEYWNQVAPQQDKLLLSYLAGGVKDLGVDLFTLKQGEVVPEARFDEKHHRVVLRLFEILERLGIITSSGGSFIRTSRPIPRASAAELHEEFVKIHPKYRCEAELMSLTGPMLAQCLSGKADPVKLLFENTASLTILEDFYTNSPMLATMTEQLVDMVTNLVSKNGGAIPYRIAELGVGFCSTTKALVQVLSRTNLSVEYTYTDISPLPVKNARKEMSPLYPWMGFNTFNLEDENVPADLARSYDLVISANCIHATSNKTSSLKKIRDLLKANGCVILSEATRVMDWYEIVYGLLDSWWLADEYPLQSANTWMHYFKSAGFESYHYSNGVTSESRTQQLLVASNKAWAIPYRVNSLVAPVQFRRHRCRTVIYKIVDEVEVPADIFYPARAPLAPMGIALMIHGGGHMTLSRKAVRPAQTAYLLENGILPVSADYRLCPEVNLIDGPIADIRDLIGWAQSTLPSLVRSDGIQLDISRIAMVGWSTGGHLCMTTAWTTKEAGIKPPRAILSFYSPTDFESGDLDVRRAEEYPERTMSLEKIRASLGPKPLTSYDSTGDVDSTGLGWVRPGDPRSELVLSLFKEGNGLPLLLNGLPSLSSVENPMLMAPSADRIAAISPLFQVRAGNYSTPTFIIHGDRDEIVPFYTAERFAKALRVAGVESGFLPVKQARHIHDLKLKPGQKEWEESVAPGYDFLINILQRQG